MQDIICVSGGFDPLHSGHLAMFRQAATYGPVAVILNSDDWLRRKKGFSFLPWQQRAAIIGELKCVARVSHVDDADSTVCEALMRLTPKYFANGGDRTSDNTPEKQICEQLGITMLWNIGGGKSDSSSAVARRGWVARPWGQFTTLDEGPGYKVKKVIIDPGCSISLQYHHHRSEYWYMAGPGAWVHIDGQTRLIDAHSPPVMVHAGMVHQLANKGFDPLTVIEIQSGHYLEEDDIIRVQEAAIL